NRGRHRPGKDSRHEKNLQKAPTLGQLLMSTSARAGTDFGRAGKRCLRPSPYRRAPWVSTRAGSALEVPGEEMRTLPVGGPRVTEKARCFGEVPPPLSRKSATPAARPRGAPPVPRRGVPPQDQGLAAIVASVASGDR